MGFSLKGKTNNKANILLINRVAINTSMVSRLDITNR